MDRTLSVTLYDPGQPLDVAISINADIVREGLATVDQKSFLCRNLPELIQPLEKLQADAKTKRVGMFKYGDASEE